jgi:LysM repeat protein
MKRFAAILFLLLVVNFANAGDNVRRDRAKYISDHKDDAIRDMIKTGVPASITLAQACLESQDGCSALAREANNHFGIKCSDWKGPSYIQDDDEKDECFRKYKTTLESYDDHSRFLMTRPRYAFLFQLELTDYKGWARGLKKAGYATDPKYAESLIKIIEDNQLYLFDQNIELPLTASIQTIPDTQPHQVVQKKVFVPSVEVVEAFATRKVLSNNGVDYVIAKKGDSFKSIAQELNLGYWQLPKYNEVSANASLSEGQIVYLKPKKKEGREMTYIVKPGDDIQSVAQNTGIKLKYLYKYNSLKEGARLEPGQQLMLKKR